MSPIKVDVEHLPYALSAELPTRRYGLRVDSIGAVIAAIDTLTVLATTVAVSAVYHSTVLGSSDPLMSPVISGVAMAGLFVWSMNARGAYALDRVLAPRIQTWPLLISWIMALLVFLGFAFVFKVSGAFSRVALLSTAVAGPGVMILQRRLLRHWLRSLLASGRFRRKRVVVVTDGPPHEFATEPFQRRGYTVARVFSVDDPQREEAFGTTAEQVLQFVRGSEVDEIHIAAEWRRWNGIKILASQFRAVPLPVRLLPDGTAADILSFSQVGIRSAYAIELQREPLSRSELALKRGFDVLLAGLGLFLTAPLLIVIAAAIRLDSKGPVFFRQTRRGFNGRTFKIFKFRSMTVLEDGPVVTQAKRDDSRVTRVGRILRSSSLDELPQIFNVLRGDMSLVGPRPHALAHDDQYTQLIETYAFRHNTKPGITGWAQVNGYRGETPTVDMMEKRVEHDLWYIANWSLWLDLWIMARTVLELLRSKSVY
jgi:Undecaprenyl-phosphate glucose phosphotransferase